MSSPFPGMNPYLEDAEIWPGFHARLGNGIADQLNSKIGPKYYADVEVRSVEETVSVAMGHTTYPDVGVFKPSDAASSSAPTLVTIPSAPVERVVVSERTKLRAVKIYVTKTSQLVTSIEILSPINKRKGSGLRKYQAKRQELLNSQAHFIELDLLRRGERPGLEVNEPPLAADYVLLVNRSREKGLRVSEIWPLVLNEAFPLLPVPLIPPDPDVALDLNEVVATIYQRAGYAWRLDYNQPIPEPELRPAMAAWWAEEQAKSGEG